MGNEFDCLPAPHPAKNIVSRSRLKSCRMLGTCQPFFSMSEVESFAPHSLKRGRKNEGPRSGSHHQTTALPRTTQRVPFKLSFRNEKPAQVKLERAFRLKINPAATYSPTTLPTQYHRL